jgi:hypothetical protein
MRKPTGSIRVTGEHSTDPGVGTDRDDDRALAGPTHQH